MGPRGPRGHRHSRIVAAPLRRPAIALATGCALVLTGLTAHRGTACTAEADRRASDRIHSTLGGHADRLRPVIRLGDSRAVATTALLIGTACALRRRRRLAVLAVAGPGITGVATTVLKRAIGRRIGGGYAFPSGHAGGLTALATVVGLVAVGHAEPAPGPGLCATGLATVSGVALAGAAMAVALVANDEHRWTEAVGGSSTAVGVVLGTGLLIDRVAGGRSPRG